jgi:hypothetical protein
MTLISDQERMLLIKLINSVNPKGIRDLAKRLGFSRIELAKIITKIANKTISQERAHLLVNQLLELLKNE